MPATKTDLTVEQGAEWAHGWAVTYNGAPIDATWTVASQVRSKVKAVEVLHQFAADVTAEGAVVIAVSAEESSAWTWTYGVYDVEVISPDGVTLRVAKGTIQVDPEVTR